MRCRRRATQRAQAAANQGTRRGAAATAGKATNGGTSTRAQQPAADGALARVIGIVARGQAYCRAGEQRQRNQRASHRKHLVFSCTSEMIAKRKRNPRSQIGERRGLPSREEGANPDPSQQKQEGNDTP
jgi:hypothetical protein